MTTYIHKYVAGCAIYQVNKVNTHPTIPALSFLSSNYICPFQQVPVDLITAPNGSFDSIMVIVDHGLMKGVILCPYNKIINAAGIAKLFFLHVFCHYGLHDKCISDQGPQFALAFATELACLLKYNLKLSSTYHPQTNGEMERLNQELETYLCIFCNGHSEKWANLLPMAEFSQNSAIHSTTNKLPFSLILGYELRSYPPIGKAFIPILETYLGELEESRKEALAAHEKAQRTMKEWISSKFHPWKSRDKVWLKGKNLKLCYPFKNLPPEEKGHLKSLRSSPLWHINSNFHQPGRYMMFSMLLSYHPIGKLWNMDQTFPTLHQI